MVAADTKKLLIYDQEGKEIKGYAGYTHLQDEDHQEYKRCKRCKRWFLLSSFPATNSGNSVDGHSGFCTECKEVMDKEKKIADSKKELAHFDTDTEEAEISVDISKKETTIVQLLPDDILIDELRSRGYKGKLTMSKEVEL